MTTKYSAEIIVDRDENLLRCFKPERIEKERASYKIKSIKNAIVFEIKANDAVALRATINSITQLLSIYERMEKIAK